MLYTLEKLLPVLVQQNMYSQEREMLVNTACAVLYEAREGNQVTTSCGSSFQSLAGESTVIIRGLSVAL
jgi:hypothetical protein